MFIAVKTIISEKTSSTNGVRIIIPGSKGAHCMLFMTQMILHTNRMLARKMMIMPFSSK